MSELISKQIGVRDVWLEEILGRQSYNYKCGEESSINNLDEEVHNLQKQKVFLCAKVPVSNISLSQTFQQLGFYIVDTNVVFEKEAQNNSINELNAMVRKATAEDEAGACEVSKNNFKFTRFHLDPNISNDVADNIKVEWVKNYFKGNRGDELVVIDQNGIKGFCLLVKKDDYLIVDLIAVDKESEKQGFATAMLQFAEKQYVDIKRIIVGTQVANVPSQRLYEKNGYRLKEASYVFHYFN